MNRAFLIIFIPALAVAAAYLYMGIHPPLRAEIGVAIFALAVAAVRIRFMLQSKKRSAPAMRPAAPPATPAGELPAPPNPTAPPAAHQP